ADRPVGGGRGVKGGPGPRARPRGGPPDVEPGKETVFHRHGGGETRPGRAADRAPVARLGPAARRPRARLGGAADPSGGPDPVHEAARHPPANCRPPPRPLGRRSWEWWT